MVTGLFLYGNQCLVTVGLNYSPAHINAIWQVWDSILILILQPSQPIFTIAIAIMIKYEKLTLKKGLGVLFATAGALTVCPIPLSSPVDHHPLYHFLSGLEEPVCGLHLLLPQLPVHLPLRRICLSYEWLLRSLPSLWSRNTSPSSSLPFLTFLLPVWWPSPLSPAMLVYTPPALSWSRSERQVGHSPRRHLAALLLGPHQLRPCLLVDGMDRDWMYWVF